MTGDRRAAPRFSIRSIQLNAPSHPAIVDVYAYMQALGVRARHASAALARASTAAKDAALRHIAATVRDRAADIAAANARDLARARANGLNLEKCVFAVSGPDFLGHCISTAGVAPLRDNV